MPVQKKCFKVVLASPSDVSEERQNLKEVIENLNEIEKMNNIGLDLYRWETDSYPALHELGPQGLIDEVLKIEDADIVIGIFSIRFGTPTHDSNSGTEHEIRKAIVNFEKNNFPEVKLYFKQEKIDPYKIDFEQFNRVKDFKKELLSKGIIQDFESADDFKEKAMRHLQIFINSKKKSNTTLDVKRDSNDNLISCSYPRPREIFSGRGEELTLFGKISASSNVISIEGLGGIGKTEFAAKCIADFFLGNKVIWFDCLPDSTLESFIEFAGFADMLKGENKTELLKFSGLIDLIERKKIIIFLDNFQDIVSSSFEEFLKFSERRLQKSKIIIISREHPKDLLLRSLKLDGLKNASLEYAQKIRNNYYADLNISDVDLEKICQNLEGHPVSFPVK